MKIIENAIFHEIFQNVFDIPSYRKAIQDAIPDKSFVKSLKADIDITEKELKKIDAKLDKLIDSVLEGKLRKETIKKREDAIYIQKDKLIEKLDTDKGKLASLPDIKDVEEEAEIIRLEVLSYFKFADTLEAKSFDEKKRLLHWLFDGKDEDGNPYGVYISRKDNDTWNYRISAKLFRGDNTITAGEFQDKVVITKEPPLAAKNKKEYLEYVNTLNLNLSNTSHQCLITCKSSILIITLSVAIEKLNQYPHNKKKTIITISTT